MIRSVIMGSASYLPNRICTNHELSEKLDTTHEWIVERSGIHQRHLVSHGETNADLATHAARLALEKAGVDPMDVDCIILATTTPDHPFPATATRVQHQLGAKKAFAFDLQAVCSGFVYALAVADNFIRLGQARHVVLIASEAMSRLLDWEDRGTCVLFGDGAGAFVLSAQNDNERGVLSTHLFSDGSMYDALYVDNTVDSPNKRGYIRMEGRTIYMQAVRRIGQAVETALAHNQLRVEDIDWFVPHQANQRIIDGVCSHFKIPVEKTVTTIANHANTSAASIPLAVDVAVQDGRIQPGQLVLIEAMGGGLTWGSALIRW